MVCIKPQRSDTNEVDEYELTVTSELHAQAERAKKQKRGGGATWPHPVEVQTKVQNRVDLLNDGAAPLVAEGGLFRQPECTG